jgi:hypothetical protein
MSCSRWHSKFGWGIEFGWREDLERGFSEPITE